MSWIEAEHSIFRKTWIRFSIAVVSVLAAILLRQAIERAIGAELPTFITLYPTLMFVALVAGFWPGVLATTLATLFSAFALPLHPHFAATSADTVALALFFVSGVFISRVAELYRRNQLQLAAYKSKQAEQQLQQVSEYHRLALEAAELGAWDYHFQSGKMHWDECCRKMFGATGPDHIDFRACLAFIHPDDRAAVEEAVKQAIAGADRGAYHRYYRVLRPDGSICWIASHGRVLFEGEGDQRHPVRFIGVKRDITRQMQAQEALRSSEARLQGIISSAMDAMITVDEQQRIVVFNQAAETVFQCPAWEALGTPIERFIPKSLRAAHREHVRRFAGDAVTKRSSNAPAILDALRANGEQFPVEATISQAEAEGKKFYTVILRDITERTQAEEVLRKQAELIDLAHNTIMVRNLDGTIRFWNRGAQEMYGYTKEEATGRIARQLLRTVFPKPIGEIEAEFLRRQRWEGELVHTAKDGTQIVVDSRWVLQRDAGGNARGVMEINNDITELKRTQEALQEGEELLQLFIEHAPAALAMFDRQMRYLSVSRRWLADFGPNRDLIGLSHYEVNADVSEQWKAAHQRGLAGEVIRADSDIYLRADGSFQWVRWEIRPWYNKAGGIGGIVIFAEDITESKQAEQALQASEQRWVTTLRSIGDAVISTDVEGHIEFMNEVAERLTKWPLPEAEGKHLSAVFTIRDELTGAIPECPIAKVLRSGKVVAVEDRTLLIARDGAEIPIQDTAAPIRGRTGQIDGVVLVFHDVVEQRKAEKALRISDRLATTGRLAATIAHEIHNPLDSVSNLLYLIAQSTGEVLTRNYASTASHELVRITQMTQRMLAFQREAAKPEPVKIAEIIESVADLYERKLKSADVHLKQEITFDGSILALPGELRQMFANLLGNAIEAVAPRHGTITVRAYQSFDHRRQCPGLRVVIADDGPGIPPAVRARIFEPFFTTKGESGTGLGLWIASEILRKYNGTLRLRTSTQPHISGTCFSVFIPFESPATETNPPKPPSITTPDKN
jgi:PAS domain S-box-containing protein